MRDQTFVNHRVAITVVKVACYADLSERYAQKRPGAERGTAIPCNFFREGMRFEVQMDPFGNCKPEGFCDWAWADIWKDVLLVCDRAGFCLDQAEIDALPPHFACCTYGLRPVTFMLQALE